MPRAEWVLDTLLAPLGRRAGWSASATRRAAARSPTRRRPSPACRRIPSQRRGDGPVRSPAGRCPGAFARREGARGRRPCGAFRRPAAAASPCRSTSSPPPSCCSPAGTSTPPTSATASAACRTSPACLRRQPGAPIDEPAVDGYVDLLRALLGAASRRARARAAAAGRLDVERRGGRRPRLRRRPHPRRRQPVALDPARLRRGGLPQRPRRAPPRLRGAAPRARRPARLAHVPPAAPHRPLLDLPAAARAARTRAASRRPSSSSPATRTRGRQPAGDVPRRIPEALACCAAGRREVGLHGNDADRLGLAPAERRPRPPRGAAGAPRRRACATTTCAASTTRRCRCSRTPASPTTQPRLRRARGLPLRRLVPLPPVRPGRGAAAAPRRAAAGRDGHDAAGAAVPRPGRRRRPSAPPGPCWRRCARTGGGVARALAQQPLRPPLGAGYDDVYWRLVDWALGEGALVGTAGEIVARRWRERAEGTGMTLRVAHLSVVHKPDDPRIYERECRTLAEAGYDVTYMVPGAPAGRDEHGVLLRAAAAARPQHALPERRRDRPTLRAPAAARAARARPRAAHALPGAQAFVPRLVYDMHEYVPEPVAAKPYIPGSCGRSRRSAAAVAQRAWRRWATAWSSWCPSQLDALGSARAAPRAAQLPAGGALRRARAAAGAGRRPAPQAHLRRQPVPQRAAAR